MLGYHPQVILAGRRINDGMGKFIAEQTVKRMIAARLLGQGRERDRPRPHVQGELPRHCATARSSTSSASCSPTASNVIVHDPIADPREAEHEYGVRLASWEELPRAAAIVAAVSHSVFAQRPLDQLLEKLDPRGIYMDVKCQADAARLRERGIEVWRL